MAILKVHIQRLVAVITANYDIGDRIPVEVFDNILIHQGLLIDNSSPDDRSTPEWAARVYHRNSVRTKFNAMGFDWSPPVALVIDQHGGDNVGLGILRLVDEGMDTTAFIKRRSKGAVSYFTSMKAEIAKRQKAYEGNNSAVDRLLADAHTISNMQAMMADNARTSIEAAIAKAEEIIKLEMEDL